MTGTLYLVPSSLGDEDLTWSLPPAVRHGVCQLDTFIVEHPKTARKFLKQIGSHVPVQMIKMFELNEHTQSKEYGPLLDPLLAGHDVGLLSEAGCPAIADPGAELIRLAHQKHIKVVPLVGPSSILLALMSSGLNGQCFAFHGYLPIRSDARQKKIIQLEQQSITQNQTQIFIETPYRNQKLFELIIMACRNNTDLCIASNLMHENEYIATRSIKDWKLSCPDIHKIPAIFLLKGAG